MDLSLLKDSLSDFATFGKNIEGALKVPGLLLEIIAFFQGFGTNVEVTGEAAGNLSS